jgi:predicted nucleotidyltransferase
MSDDLLEAFLAHAEGDQDVVGLVLTGSAARGIATTYSDLDVYVVLRTASREWVTVHTAGIDIPVVTLDQLREIPEDPRDWDDRWSFAYARVLMDRTDGELRRLVNAQATLTPAEVSRALATYLDGYINFAYRSLKSHREGKAFEARLDAVESLSWGLPVVFALHGRVRPYNKYLRWELENHPFEDPRWEPLLMIIDEILDTDDPAPQRALFQLIEPGARAAGFGELIDAWGEELSLFE